MVGDALAVWDMCSRYTDVLRLPPFPFARLAAALCPDLKSFSERERGGAGGTRTPASAATPLATPSLTPSLMKSPDFTAASVGIPTAFSDAVGAEWLAALAFAQQQVVVIEFGIGRQVDSILPGRAGHPHAPIANRVAHEQSLPLHGLAGHVQRQDLQVRATVHGLGPG